MTSTTSTATSTTSNNSGGECPNFHEIVLISKVPAAQLSKTRLRQSLLQYCNYSKNPDDNNEKTMSVDEVDEAIKSLTTAMLKDIFLQLLTLDGNTFHITWLFFPPSSDMHEEASHLVESVKSDFVAKNPSYTHIPPQVQYLPNTFNQKDLSIILQEIYKHFQHSAR